MPGVVPWTVRPTFITEQPSPGTLTAFVSQLNEADLELSVQLLCGLLFAATDTPAPIQSKAGLPEGGWGRAWGINQSAG